MVLPDRCCTEENKGRAFKRRQCSKDEKGRQVWRQRRGNAKQEEKHGSKAENLYPVSIAQDFNIIKYSPATGQTLGSWVPKPPAKRP